VVPGPSLNHCTFKSTLVAAVIAAGFIAPVDAADPIKIGVVTPLSGTYAGIGQQVKWGLELAAKEINAAGGIMDRKVELIYEDEEANPSVASQKAEKHFQVSKVDFLTGTVNSASTLVVAKSRNGTNASLPPPFLFPTQ
jgi:branched-chain amino acid transport system substrate-binding protein